LKAEANATRKCLERVPESKYDWKPHDKSMTFGYLALIVAEIPLWIAQMVEKSEIDFVKFEHYKVNDTTGLVKHFDENLAAAREALGNTNDIALAEQCHLKADGKIIYSSPKKDNVGITLNHWVHHRGQLSVYLRLNDIPVPSIYGPSADDKSF
jgi:uncharacterized damage-inducible protein DinB